MGPGSSTLRIDEPLHLMFLLAYLITYFCCAYILFVCFKNCRRLVQRKPSRPVVSNLSRLRSIAEAMNALPCRTPSSSRTSARQVHVSLCNLIGGTHTVLCPAYEEGRRDISQSQLSVADTTEANTSRRSALQMTTFTFRRIYYDQHHSPITCLIVTGDEESQEEDNDELPHYDSILNAMPPSYSECVLSTLACPSSSSVAGAQANNITPITTMTGSSADLSRSPSTEETTKANSEEISTNVSAQTKSLLEEDETEIPDDNNLHKPY